MSDGNDDDNDSDDRLWLGLVGWVWESSPLFIPSNFCSRILLRILFKPHSNFFLNFFGLRWTRILSTIHGKCSKYFSPRCFQIVWFLFKSHLVVLIMCAYYTLPSLICTFMSPEGIYRSSGTIELLVI